MPREGEEEGTGTENLLYAFLKNDAAVWRGNYRPERTEERAFSKTRHISEGT